MTDRPAFSLRAGLLVAAALASGARAETFTRIGPDGGDVRCVEADPTSPSVLYAGTSGGGVYKTTDGGSTWRPASAGGLANLTVQALVLHPGDPSTLFAGTNAGVFKSTDAGGFWSPSSSGLPSGPIGALAIEPSPEAVLYAGTLSGVARSTDGGASWTDASNGLERRQVRSIAVSRRPPYLALLTAGGSDLVWYTADRGGSWAVASTPGLDGAVPEKLRIVTRPAPGVHPLAEGVWEVVDITHDEGFSVAVLVYTLPLVLSFRRYRTDPLFRRYVKDIVEEIGPPPLPMGGPAPLADAPKAIYAASFEGVIRSTDEGTTWALVNNGLTNRNVGVLGMSVSSTVFAAAFGTGLFRSTDRGASWSFASKGIGAAQVTSIVSPPGGALFAAFAGGVSRSADGGASWTLATQGLVDRFGEAVYLNALAAAGDGTLYAATGSGVYKTTDAGGTWKAATAGIGTSNIATVAVDPVTPATLYAIAGSTFGGGSLFKSTDAGASWTRLTGISGAQGIAVDPRTPSKLFAGAERKFQVSTDGGATWTAATNDFFYNYVSNFAIDATNGARVYVGTDEGAFRSTDGGASFTHLGLQLPNFLAPYVTAIAVDPRAPASVYAATRSNGLYRSTDGGSSWRSYGPGLTATELAALAFDPAGRLLVGSAGAGIFALSASADTSAILASSARAGGAGGAFYTTDVTVANVGNAPSAVVLKFLGHEEDGRGGAERSFPIGAGATLTFADVLGSVFGRESDYGAIRVSSPSPDVRVLSQTSTPGFGGTFGQSVPAARPEDLVVGGTPRSILAVREDAAFRTNLILANAADEALPVDVTLVADTGAVLGRAIPLSRPVALAAAHVTLPPLGMKQVSHVVRALGVATDVRGARLVLSTPSTGLAFAAYAALIDNATNDPRTLLPLGPIASDRASSDVWLLPSSARTSGFGGAFFTTDLTIAYTNDVSARFNVKFLGNNQDGRGGPEKTFDLDRFRSVTYADVLGTVFNRTSDFGAIRVSAQFPIADTEYIAVLSQTSTPGFGGTFGQSVPAATAADLIRRGVERSILGVREDAAFRTNLILANAGESAIEVAARLVSPEGATLASKSYPLAPLGMTQVTQVARDMGVSGEVSGARLVLSTPTAGGAFAAYASAIDNVTQDPRTLLPR